MVIFSANDVISDFLGGAITGSTAYVWGLTLTSGSVDNQISYAEYYIKSRVGDDLYNNSVGDWDVQSAATLGNMVKSAVMDYVCFRISVMFSGGIITDGFDYQVGPLRAARSRAYVQFFDGLITKFRDAAEQKLIMLTPLSYSSEDVMNTTETPDWASEPAASLY